MFYLDFVTEKGGTLRLFKVRQELNLLTLETGRMAEAEGEAGALRYVHIPADPYAGSQLLCDVPAYQQPEHGGTEIRLGER